MLKKTATFNKKLQKLIPIALIIILGFSVYVNSLKGQFIWDDDILIRDNNYIKHWFFIKKIFTEDVGAGAMREYNFYRPLQMLTYMFDYSLWKLNVIGYHLSNIILHILVALCIYWFINIVFDDQTLSFLCSIFFVAHPIHTEAITYISGRSDPLAFIFLLLSFIFYIKQLLKPSRKLFLFMMSSYILALLSREHSLILPALILLYHSIFKKKIKPKEFTFTLLITCIYIALRLTVLRNLLTGLHTNTTILQRLPGFFVAITNYMRLLLFPFDLHMTYVYRFFYFTDIRAIIGIVIIAVLITIALRQQNKNRLISFSIFWFFIALLPVSNLYPINAYMTEHWLYLSSLGFFLLLARGVSFLFERKELRISGVIFTITLLAFYSYLTIKQNTYWKEPIAFYERTLKYAQQGPIEGPTVFNNLGLAYYGAGKYEVAIESYKKAIALDPFLVEAYYNLGCLYTGLGKNEEAITAYKKSIELNPNLVDVYNNLGGAYAAIGKNEEAIAACKKVIALNPYSIEAYYNMGMMYVIIGKREEALTAFQKTIEIDPRHAAAYGNLALIYYNKKQYDLAIKYCDKAIELGYRVPPDFLKLLEPFRNKK